MLQWQDKRQQAISEIQGFHRRLCTVCVLDPACGTGNFLYVTLEHLKRLEGEVLDALDTLGAAQTDADTDRHTVEPHQLLGLEVNPRAAAIARLVLWIGYLQWHFRTRGQVVPPQPILKNAHNIVCRDALLAWEHPEPVLDDTGQPVTRWNGHTFKMNSVTGEAVPDDTVRVPVVRYIHPRQAVWPEAEFVVGNPPFLGNWRLRSVLGDGYAEALRAAYPEVPASCDYVMYWWHQAAQLARTGDLRRFGLITTNSLRQTFNRRIVHAHLAAKEPLAILFAIADHPWVDTTDGADVRIAMTVGTKGAYAGVLETVRSEMPGEDGGIEVALSQRRGVILADLTIGANVAAALPLKANADLSCRGVALHGAGFIVTPEQACQLGLGRVPDLENHIRHYRNGRDVTAIPRHVMVIDLFGLSVEEVRDRFPEVYQWVYERVKPERDQNNWASYRENWWIFGEPRANFRPALKGLSRYIATVETAKHRFFIFLDAAILPDNKLVNIALDDAYFLGILSSRIHVAWAMAAGSRLGVGNDPVYVKTRCFDTFPFPDASDAQKARIRDLAERLDAHRKRQQALYPKLTLTDMYNVLEKLRSGASLSQQEQTIHEQGLVSVLRQLHDDLDAAVLEAYGWPASLPDDEILTRLVALNTERVAEERRGVTRWLRPALQNPDGVTQTGAYLEEKATASPGSGQVKKLPWPSTLAAQAQAVRTALAGLIAPATPASVAGCFTRAPLSRVTELLETLVSLGQAYQLNDGTFVGH